MATAKPNLIVLTGPTASGKSGLALELASRINAVIINADSVSVYRDFNIGSGKPTAAELASVPHELVSVCHPAEEFNAGVFCREASAAISRAIASGRQALVAGGTGLYIRSLLCGLIPAADVPLEAQNDIIERILDALPASAGDDADKTQALYAHLKTVDPNSAAKLHENDRARIRRALVVFYAVGTQLSTLQSQHRQQERPYRCYVVSLMPERKLLYQRIDRRVDEMFAAGFLAEVKALRRTYGSKSRALTSIGYGHVSAFLDDACSFEEMVEQLKRDTRRFAKRQLTWWRNQPARLGWICLESSDFRGTSHDLLLTQVIRQIEEFLENKGDLAANDVYYRTIYC